MTLTPEAQYAHRQMPSRAALDVIERAAQRVVNGGATGEPLTAAYGALNWVDTLRQRIADSDREIAQIIAEAPAIEADEKFSRNGVLAVLAKGAVMTSAEIAAALIDGATGAWSTVPTSRTVAPMLNEAFKDGLVKYATMGGTRRLWVRADVDVADVDVPGYQDVEAVNTLICELMASGRASQKVAEATGFSRSYIREVYAAYRATGAVPLPLVVWHTYED